jgi:pyridoxal phosphate enzyme (YggS family)
MMNLRDRYQHVMERVVNACHRCGRSPSDVTVLAVSKRQPDEAVKKLFELGHRDFGENQIQAWASRLESTDALDIRWHLVGPIQSNKAKRVVSGKPELIHSIDRINLIETLSKRIPDGQKLDALIQVNVDREAQKTGCGPDELQSLVESLSKSPGLRLRGLMCIPRPTQQGVPRRAFESLRLLLDGIVDQVEGRPILSMGMSMDFEAAITEGSNLIRLGTAIFGPRPE